MSLPVRVSRQQRFEPSELMRRDWPGLMDRFFWPSAFFGDWGAMGAAAPFGVDIREDADHLFVEADLPGFNKDEVDVTMEGGTLTITAEKHRQTEPAGKKQRRDEGNYLLREREYERYERSFTLPRGVDEQSVNAKLENGCLLITLNKTEQSKAKKIPLA